MRFVFALPLIFTITLALAGCITEPAPSEPHSYGQITSAAKATKAKKQKAPKKKKEPETTTRTVQPFDERQPQP